MARRNAPFEVEQVEQLALINRLATHHDSPPSLKVSGGRDHDSPIFTRTFSTASTHLSHAQLRIVAVQGDVSFRYSSFSFSENCAFLISSSDGECDILRGVIKATVGPDQTLSQTLGTPDPTEDKPKI
jgi:hypothetical protein